MQAAVATVQQRACRQGTSWSGMCGMQRCGRPSMRAANPPPSTTSLRTCCWQVIFDGCSCFPLNSNLLQKVLQLLEASKSLTAYSLLLPAPQG